MFNPSPTLIARKDIKRGDLLVQVWRNYCRPVFNDKNSIRTNFRGISFSKCKKGQRARIVRSVDNLYDVPVGKKTKDYSPKNICKGRGNRTQKREIKTKQIYEV